MSPYFKGARFAAMALRMRVPEAKDEADRLVRQMDHHLEATKRLQGR